MKKKDIHRVTFEKKAGLLYKHYSGHSCNNSNNRSPPHMVFEENKT